MCAVNRSKMIMLLELFGYPTGSAAAKFNVRGRHYGDFTVSRDAKTERMYDLYEKMQKFMKRRRNKDYFTVADAIALSGFSEPTVRRQIRALVEEGLLVIVPVTIRFVTYKIPPNKMEL